MEAHKGFKLQNQELEICLCEVRTGCGTEVAPRSATKEDGCPFSVVTSEAHSVGSTQQFRVLLLTEEILHHFGQHMFCNPRAPNLTLVMIGSVF